MKKKWITFFLLLTAFTYSADSSLYRSFTLSAAYQFDFVNTEQKHAAAVLYLHENGSFEYRERAGRGETIFIGNYSFNENILTLKNDNGKTRKFSVDMNTGSLKLTAHPSSNTAERLFHVQPASAGQDAVYRRIAPKPLDLKNSRKVNSIYVYSENQNSYAMLFGENNEFHLIGIFVDIKNTVIIGKYSWINHILSVEDEQGFRYRFKAEISGKKLIISRLSQNFILPFKETQKPIIFQLRNE